MATSTFYGNLVDYNVMPTENDHCGSGFGGEGAGRIPQELTLTPLLYGLGGNTGYTVSGFALPASGTLAGSKINANITAGVAIVQGYRIAGTSVINVDFTISATNYVFLKLEKDVAGRVYRPVIHIDDASYTIPDHAILLGTVVCNATTITSANSYRWSNRFSYGVIDYDSPPKYGDLGSGNWSAVFSTGQAVVTYKTPFLRVPTTLMSSYDASCHTLSSVTETGFTISFSGSPIYSYGWFKIG